MMDTLSPPADKSAEQVLKDRNRLIEDDLRSSVDLSKKSMGKFHSTWDTNVEMRRGKTTTTQTVYPSQINISDYEEPGRAEINPDWSLTKNKVSNLFSQVPAVQCTHENEAYAAAVPFFAKDLNYELGEKRTNPKVAMTEILSDVVNASGIGGIFVG